MAQDSYGQYYPDFSHPAIPLGQASGSGSPEGVVSGTPGKFYWDATGNNLYVKDTGNGTKTGWVLFSGSGGGGGGATAPVSGSGSPEGVVTADPGTPYWDATNKKWYVKDTGTGNTGWAIQVG